MELEFPRIWKTLAAQFQLPEWSIHGPTHWKNVEQFGIALTRDTGAGETVVRLFAVFGDAEHGVRGARLALEMSRTRRIRFVSRWQDGAATSRP